MNLKHLTDKTLIEETRKLASAEREVTVKILHHLREIDQRKLYSDLGFSSLYDYCIRDLGYAEASAHRRISGARLLRELPSIEHKIECGALNLTNVASLVHFFREENIVDSTSKEDVITKVEGLSRRECDLKLLQLSGKSPEIKKEAVGLSGDTIHIIKNYRNLKGTSESLAEIILEISLSALAELEKSKFKLVKNPRTSSLGGSRIPSASLKREVYLRDKKCTKCGSSFGLQFDHRQPYSLGGKSTPENIRLLCSNCNQRERIRQRL